MEFKEIYEKLRKEKKFSYDEIANFCGVNKTTAWKWSKGEMMPKHEKIEQLAELFNVSIDYLTGKTEEKKINDDIYLKKISRLMTKLNENDKKILLSIIENVLKIKENN